MNEYKVTKHFDLEIGEEHFTYQLLEEKVAAYGA